MTDVFYLRSVSPPARLEDLPAMAAQAQGCFGLHRVDWRMSFLSLDGSEMLCWYRAPDAESARIALRQLGADMEGVWPGRWGPPLQGGTDPLADVSVLAVVPVALGAEAQAAVTDTVQSGGGGVAARIGSLDGSRSVWLLRSAEVDAVLAAFNASSVPDVQAWGCRTFRPESRDNP